MQRICRSAALLTALTVTSGACRYLAGDTCDDDACLANHPPVAVISDVNQDGALRVGNAGEVLVSARESSDPDGDVLSYAWAVDEPCTALVVGDLTAEDLRLDDLPGGSTCVVRLTVTDTQAKSAGAEATLIIRNIGAHVTSNGDSCVVVFEPDSDVPQGTASTPFCTVDQAVMAASTFHLGEISMDGGTHSFTGRMVLDFPVTLRGGYTANATDWIPSGTGVTTILALQQAPTGAIDAQVSVTGSATVGFADLSVRRSGQCRSDCTLIQATDASLELVNVVLGNPSVLSNGTANDATGRLYTSVGMTAPRPVVARGRTLTAQDLTIYGSANAATSVGIMLDGSVSALLTNLASFERASVSVALRSLNALDLRVVNPAIDVLAPGGASSQGYGIADGNRNSPGVTTCTSAVLCDGSSRVVVEGGSISVKGGEVVMGIDVQGTSTMQLKGTTVDVDGQQAFGVFGSGASEAVIDDLTVTATTRRYRTGLQAFAVGVSDNLDAVGAEVFGAKAYRMTDGRVTVNVVGTDINQAAALNLSYSENVDIGGTVFAIHGDSPTAAEAESVAGVRLLSTNTVTITDVSVEVVGFKVSGGIAGVVDGELLLPTDAARGGSEQVTLRNVDVLTNVAADLLTTSACVVLVGTHGATIDGAHNTTSMTCRTSGAALSYGVLTNSTRDLTMREASVLVGSATVALPTFGTMYIGVHDGGLTDAQTDQASDNLTITGNRINLTQLDGVEFGIQLRGPAPTAAPIIDDNYIRISNSTRNVGVVLRNSNATVALNTMRLQGCPAGPPCAQAYAVGIYILHSEAYASKFLGNVMGVMGPMDAMKRPAFVRHNYLNSGVDANIGTVTANVFGGEQDSSEASFVAAIASDSNDVTTPVAMPGYGVGNVPGDANIHAAPEYCADGVHGKPTGPQRHAAALQMPVFGLDIDGEERLEAGLDAGADLIADSCP